MTNGTDDLGQGAAAQQHELRDYTPEPTDLLARIAREVLGYEGEQLILLDSEWREVVRSPEARLYGFNPALARELLDTRAQLAAAQVKRDAYRKALETASEARAQEVA